MTDPEDIPALRAQVDKLKGARRGLKGSLTRTKNQVEAELDDFPEGDDPVILEKLLVQWETKLTKFQQAEEDVICHEGADDHDVDKDATFHEVAFAKAAAKVTTLRRVHEKAKESLTIQVHNPREGGDDVRGALGRFQKLDIQKPPTIEESVDHREFARWRPLWDNYARLAALHQRPQSIQVVLQVF